MADQAWAESVDRLLRLPRRHEGGTERGYRAGAAGSLRGRWIGRYAQPRVSSRPVWMDLVIDVQASGDRTELLVADGNDPIGRFTLEATLVPDDPVVRLTKRYVGGHLISYNAVFDDRSLRGVWHMTMENLGLFAFHHEDVLDRAVFERKPPKRFLDKLYSLLFYEEPAIDVVEHRRLMERFWQLQPDLRPVGGTAWG